MIKFKKFKKKQIFFKNSYSKKFYRPFFVYRSKFFKLFPYFLIKKNTRNFDFITSRVFILRNFGNYFFRRFQSSKNFFYFNIFKRRFNFFRFFFYKKKSKFRIKKFKKWKIKKIKFFKMFSKYSFIRDRFFIRRLKFFSRGVFFRFGRISWGKFFLNFPFKRKKYISRKKKLGVKTLKARSFLFKRVVSYNNSKINILKRFSILRVFSRKSSKKFFFKKKLFRRKVYSYKFWFRYVRIKIVSYFFRLQRLFSFFCIRKYFPNFFFKGIFFKKKFLFFFKFFNRIKIYLKFLLNRGVSIKKLLKKNRKLIRSYKLFVPFTRYYFFSVKKFNFLNFPFFKLFNPKFRFFFKFLSPFFRSFSFARSDTIKFLKFQKFNYFVRSNHFLNDFNNLKVSVINSSFNDFVKGFLLKKRNLLQNSFKQDFHKQIDFIKFKKFYKIYLFMKIRKKRLLNFFSFYKNRFIRKHIINKFFKFPFYFNCLSKFKKKKIYSKNKYRDTRRYKFFKKLEKLKFLRKKKFILSKFISKSDFFVKLRNTVTKRKRYLFAKKWRKKFKKINKKLRKKIRFYFPRKNFSKKNFSKRKNFSYRFKRRKFVHSLIFNPILIKISNKKKINFTFSDTFFNFFFIRNFLRKFLKNFFSFRKIFFKFKKKLFISKKVFFYNFNDKFNNRRINAINERINRIKKSISKKRRTIIFNFFKNVKLPFLRTFKFNKKFKIILKNGKRKFSLKNKKFSKFFKKKRSSFSHFFKFKGKRKFLRKKIRFNKRIGFKLYNTSNYFKKSNSIFNKFRRNYFFIRNRKFKNLRKSIFFKKFSKFFKKKRSSLPFNFKFRRSSYFFRYFSILKNFFRTSFYSRNLFFYGSSRFSDQFRFFKRKRKFFFSAFYSFFRRIYRFKNRFFKRKRKFFRKFFYNLFIAYFLTKRKHDKYSNLKNFVSLYHYKNNFFIYLHNSNGKIIYKSTNGIVGYKGPKKSTTFACEINGRKIGRYMKFFKTFPIVLVIKCKVNTFVRSAIRGITYSGVRFNYIKRAIIKGHNGLRKPSLRRVLFF